MAFISNQFLVYHPVPAGTDSPVLDPRDGAKHFFTRLLDHNVSHLTRSLVISALMLATEEDQEVLGFGYRHSVTVEFAGRSLDDDSALTALGKHLGGEYVELGRNDLERLPVSRLEGVRVRREVTDFITFEHDAVPRRLFPGDVVMRSGEPAMYLYLPEAWEGRYPNRFVLINECPNEFSI
jgi:hypothetical protein